jgi:leucine dehydrogenase
MSSILDIAKQRGHEQYVYFNYPEVGLRAYVGIHSTVLGPALGGCRMRLYETDEQALEDCLRLSEGMSYKNSVAGLDIGGGKSVIIADPFMKEGREKLFQKFGECLQSLSGRYITAEDMGTSVADVMEMRKTSNCAAGFDPAQGGGGDPSPWTALGTFLGMQAACEFRYGSNDLKGRTVAVQGAGHVGMYLIEHLAKAGAIIYVSDTNQTYLDRAKKDFNANIVGLDEIYSVKADIFSPNAIGQTVNHKTISSLSCEIIAGAANNQLIDSSMYEALSKKNITYCPDFVINSGGVISVAAELNKGGWKEEWVRGKVERIGQTVFSCLKEAQKEDQPSEVIALRMAKERIQRVAEEKAKAA